MCNSWYGTFRLYVMMFVYIMSAFLWKGACWMQWLLLLWEQPNISHRKGIHTSSSGKGVGNKQSQDICHFFCIGGTTDSHLWDRPQSCQKEYSEEAKRDLVEFIPTQGHWRDKQTNLEVKISLQGHSERVSYELL